MLDSSVPSPEKEREFKHAQPKLTDPIQPVSDTILQFHELVNKQWAIKCAKTIKHMCQGM